MLFLGQPRVHHDTALLGFFSRPGDCTETKACAAVKWRDEVS